MHLVHLECAAMPIGQEASLHGLVIYGSCTTLEKQIEQQAPLGSTADRSWAGGEADGPDLRVHSQTGQPISPRTVRDPWGVRKPFCITFCTHLRQVAAQSDAS